MKQDDFRRTTRAADPIPAALTATKKLIRATLPVIEALILSVAGLAAPTGAGPTFTASLTGMGGGAEPEGITAGDLDGDGDLDLATANHGSNDVSVLENDGRGSLAANTYVAGGHGPRGITAGDLDGDGDLDLATANHGSDDVSLLENDGTGSFTAATTSIDGYGPRGITAGDLDGDGDLDLATANHGSDDVSLLENDGTGTFTAPRFGRIYLGASPEAITAGDFDGDGDLDLASANTLAGGSFIGAIEVSLLKNDGTASFTESAYVAAGDGPRGITAADLDRDGDLDLATANRF